MDGGRVNHRLDPRLLLNVAGPLSVIHSGPLGLQPVGQLRLMGIRSRHRKSLVQQNLRQTAHADASNSNKMHMRPFAKIYLIHRSFPFPARKPPF